MKAMRSVALALFSAAALASACLQAGAQNLVTNGDMEGPWTNGGVYTIGSQIGGPIDGFYPNGWTPYSQRMADTQYSTAADPQFRDEDLTYGSTPNQNHHVRIIQGYGPAVNFRGGLVQAVATTPGQDYDLDVQLQAWGSGIDTLRGYIGYDPTGQTTDPLAPTIVWTPTYYVSQFGTWSQYSLRFSAIANSNGNQTSIWLQAVMPDGGQGYLDIDNVSVTQATTALLTITDGPYVNRLSDTSYEIVWTTNQGSDSTVQYGENPPDNDAIQNPQEPTYASSVTQSGITVTHSVVLAGLTADKVYHFRVKSAAPGYKTIYSKDQTFATPAPANATFQNGDFEITDPPSPPAAGNQTAPGWRTYTLDPLRDGFGGYQDPDGIVTGVPPTGFGNWNGYAKAQHGNNFIVAASEYGIKNGGFLQRVAATPGQTYTVSGYIGAYNSGADPNDTRVWVGIDPNGGIDATNPNIVWNDEAQRVGDNQLLIKYVPTSVAATATANVITIFIRFEQKWPLHYNINVADNFSLQGPPGESTPVSNIGAAKDLADGVLAEITDGMIVTAVANFPDSGFFYMQDPGGNAGIRVETNGTVPAIGDQVLVKGILGTNPNGERVLRDSIITPDGTGTTVVRTMANKSVGGAGYINANLGLDTQGLLVRVFGKITKFDVINDYMIIDDGSNVDPLEQDGTLGLKIVHTGYFPGSLDEYLSVTGVVTSEQINGQNIRVIRGRDGVFPTDVYDLKQ